MGTLESLLAAAPVGALLYVGDRGIAFQVCAYFAIASGGKFTGEQAYQQTENPFVRASKLVPAFALVIATFVFARKGGNGADWQIGVTVAFALWYAAIVTIAALKAFRRTQFASYFEQ
jgi:hypothetical protein